MTQGAAFWLIPFSAILVLKVDTLNAMGIDNGVIGKPTIYCYQDNTEILLITRRRLKGKLFVKGHSTETGCVNNRAALMPANWTDENTLQVRFDDCGVIRQRTTNPRGVSVSTTVVLQFHPLFITKVDVAYRIVCFFREYERTVSNNFEVSMLSTRDSVTHAYPMPDCTYTIRSKSFDGPIVRFLRIGDPVFHRWECVHPPSPDEDGINPYGMLIHSCFVGDEGKTKIMLVDNHGCAMDPYIMGHLKYSDDVLKAYIESHVFKFADRNQVAFSCQVRLCVKTMNTCGGMTPPKCLPLKNKRSIKTMRAQRLPNNATQNDDKPSASLEHPSPYGSDDSAALLLNHAKAPSFDTTAFSSDEDFDLYSNRLIVLDARDEWPTDAYDDWSANGDVIVNESSLTDTVCLSHGATVVLVLIFVLVLGLLIVALSLLRWKRRRRSTNPILAAARAERLSSAKPWDGISASDSAFDSIPSSGDSVFEPNSRAHSSDRVRETALYFRTFRE